MATTSEVIIAISNDIPIPVLLLEDFDTATTIHKGKGATYYHWYKIKWDILENESVKKIQDFLNNLDEGEQADGFGVVEIVNQDYSDTQGMPAKFNIFARMTIIKPF